MKRIGFPLALSVAALASAQAPAQTFDVWLGTSRGRPASGVVSEGIYACTLDAKTGRLGKPRLAAKIDAPGFLALHPRGDRLYAVGRRERRGVVATYAIRRAEGAPPKLEPREALPIGKGVGTHLAVDARGRTRVTAQYGAGSVACIALGEGGALAERTQVFEHEGGSGVVARRQERPHPHWVGFFPDQRYVFVPDLGLDAVVAYAFDSERGRLARHKSFAMPAGSGPRHMKFHPTLPRAYVLGELTLAITVCAYDRASGALEPIQTVPTVDAADLKRERFKSASEIRVHPSGRFVYSANRGHDSISVFAVDAESGKLTRVEIEPCRGATPRNFALDPTGRFLLVAGQDSHTLASFSIDQETGALRYTRSIVHVPAPICVVVARRDAQRK